MRSKYILQKILEFLPKKRTLAIVKYNKKLQEKLNLNINNYKEYSEKYSSIEIEIIPMKIKSYKLIYIKEEDEEYYHIYYNDNKKEEIKSTSLNKNDKVSKINIVIDYQIESFYNLFYNCECIESICFKKFYRKNITNMSCMFYECSSLKEINLYNFNTNNVINMSGMLRDVHH